VDYEQSAPGPIFWIIWCAVMVFFIATFWKVFEKAGKPGWASIIPIYNSIVILQIAGRPVWWFLLFLIPIVNIVVGIIVYIDISKAFGHGVGFGWGLALLGFIFFPILAWGDSRYQGTPQHG